MKKPVSIPKGYRPKEKEKFMNPVMREYFRRKLLHWKDELLDESAAELETLPVPAVSTVPVSYSDARNTV